MRTRTTHTFLKQLAELPDGIREQVEEFTFHELPKLNSLNNIANIKKLKGYKSCFRVRFGNYRLGIEIEEDVAVLRVVMHRRNVYRRFP